MSSCKGFGVCQVIWPALSAEHATCGPPGILDSALARHMIAPVERMAKAGGRLSRTYVILKSIVAMCARAGPVQVMNSAIAA